MFWKRSSPEASPERIVSPQTLAGLFHTAAETILADGKGQRFGSYVTTYDNQVAIKEPPSRGRVTYAQLSSPLSEDGPLVVTHRLLLPSVDRYYDRYTGANVRYTAGKVIFELLHYDEAGVLLQDDTERTVAYDVDMSGSGIRPYLEKIDGLEQD